MSLYNSYSRGSFRGVSLLWTWKNINIQQYVVCHRPCTVPVAIKYLTKRHCNGRRIFVKLWCFSFRMQQVPEFLPFNCSFCHIYEPLQISPARSTTTSNEDCYACNFRHEIAKWSDCNGGSRAVLSAVCRVWICTDIPFTIRVHQPICTCAVMGLSSTHY